MVLVVNPDLYVVVLGEYAEHFLTPGRLHRSNLAPAAGTRVLELTPALKKRGSFNNTLVVYMKGTLPSYTLSYL